MSIGLWHVAMLFDPEAGAPAPELVLQYMVRMALASVVIASFYERSNRGVARGRHPRWSS
jgi:hypothetical protein